MTYIKGTLNDILYSTSHKCPCGNYVPNQPRIAMGHASFIDEEDNLRKVAFHLTMCPLCHSVQLKEFRECLTVGFVDANDDSLEIYGWDVRVLYQSPILNDAQLVRESSIPKAIRDVLSQAQGVAHISPRASYILCRATLEEVCRAFNAEGRDLKSKLEGLVESQDLPPKLSKILQGIRLIGNEGAHGAEEFFAAGVGLEEVDMLIRLVNYVLERLYVDKARDAKAESELDALTAAISPSAKTSKAKQ